MRDLGLMQRYAGTARDYCAWWLAVYDAIKAGRKVTPEWNAHTLGTLAEARAYFGRALDNRINDRGRVQADNCYPYAARDRRRGHANQRTTGSWEGRRWSQDHERALRNDQRAIHEYRTRRIVRSGSGLDTTEARRRFPDIQARFTERDW
jgi:hypothetical protein